MPAAKTVMESLIGSGLDIPYDCSEGLCGTCEAHNVKRQIDHCDREFGSTERARTMTCCSRAVGKKIILAL